MKTGLLCGRLFQVDLHGRSNLRFRHPGGNGNSEGERLEASMYKLYRSSSREVMGNDNGERRR